MTQPHYIDREAVVALIEKLRAVESSCGPSDWSGIRQVTTNWHHNPDGPEAADLIEKLSRPMETVAWREKVARIIDPAAFLFGPDELDAKVYSASRAHAFDRADAILQALAVIPTEGGENQ